MWAVGAFPPSAVLTVIMMISGVGHVWCQCSLRQYMYYYSTWRNSRSLTAQRIAGMQQRRPNKTVKHKLHQTDLICPVFISLDGSFLLFCVFKNNQQAQSLQHFMKPHLCCHQIEHNAGNEKLLEEESVFESETVLRRHWCASANSDGEQKEKFGFSLCREVQFVCGGARKWNTESLIKSHEYSYMNSAEHLICF